MHIVTYKDHNWYLFYLALHVKQGYPTWGECWYPPPWPKYHSTRHGILHKPSKSVKFWPKSFRKSNGIFNIFCITNYAWFLTFLAWQCGKFKLYLPYCGKYPKLLSTLWNYQCFFHKIIHIVNHLEYFFHISSIEPKYLRGLPQILPQSAKFLPRACSWRLCNIPSLRFN